MKKIQIIILLTSLLLLIGCKSTIQEDTTLDFDGIEFSYIGDTDDDYRFYRTGTIELEVKMDENNDLIASYVKDLDIYIILGQEDNFRITKNGSLILACSGEDIVCSGIESPSFLNDIPNLFELFTPEDNSNTVMLVIGLILSNISVILFFIPDQTARLLDNTKLASHKIIYTRTLYALLFIVGIFLVTSSL